jgi:hypothetical protein
MRKGLAEALQVAKGLLVLGRALGYNRLVDLVGVVRLGVLDGLGVCVGVFVVVGHGEVTTSLSCGGAAGDKLD